MSSSWYMPPEWAPRECTLMAWPVREEAWLNGLASAREGYVEAAHAIIDFEKLVMVARSDVYAEARKRLSREIEVVEFPHDDSWLRDNGPTVVLERLEDGPRKRPAGRRGIHWGFNAWGNKYSPHDKDAALATPLLEKLQIPEHRVDLVLEGGSIHVDGEGTLLSTEECLLNPNRNPALGREEIEAILKVELGVQTIVWLGKGLANDETDGHVDNVACFAQPGRIVAQTANDQNSANWESTRDNIARLSLARDARGRSFEIVRIPEPPARSMAGEALSLSYINYYPVEGGIILPIFGIDAKRTDDGAVGILKEVFPDRKIRCIDGMKIIAGGGNVHCITQQIPGRS